MENRIMDKVKNELIADFYRKFYETALKDIEEIVKNKI